MPSLRGFKYDRVKEENGVWFTTPEGLKLKIARLGNRNAVRFTRKLALENQRALKRDQSGDLLLELAIKAQAKYVLVDWADMLEDDEVTPLPYSFEKAKELLTEYPAFLEEVLEYANRDDEFREEMTETAIKNS